MLIDLTVKVTKLSDSDVLAYEKYFATGHIGTHIDTLGKEFPLEYSIRKGIVFDVARVTERDITSSDIDMRLITSNMFVIFRTGFIDVNAYGSKEYIVNNPQLSDELIEKLVEKKVSLIGIDCSGVRRGAGHKIADRYCADRGVFIVENLCNLGKLVAGSDFVTFKAYTFPVNFSDLTGLPCRVVAEI